MPPSGVGLPDPLPDLKEPPPAGNAIAFEAWGDGKADGLVSAAFIRPNKIGVHGVKPALPAFHRSVETLEVDCDVSALLHASVRLLSAASAFLGFLFPLGRCCAIAHIQQHFDQFVRHTAV